MIARALLLIAVFAGLLGGQVEARGLCGSAQVCAGCCAPEGDASCCAPVDKPAAPAPVANLPADWKFALQPIVTLLPRRTAAVAEEPNIFPHPTPRADGLARAERTCIRLI